MKSDDGIGLRLIEHLNQNLNQMRSNDDIRFIDIGSNGLNLLHYFESTTKKILLVDAAKMGLQPGEFGFFDPMKVKNQHDSYNISTHEDDILSVIELATKLNYNIPPIRCMGIEPSTVGQGLALSIGLRNKLEYYSSRAIEEINKNW